MHVGVSKTIRGAVKARAVGILGGIRQGHCCGWKPRRAVEGSGFGRPLDIEESFIELVAVTP
jgi:hypothetical protein